MTEFDDQIAAAGDALEALADGPAAAAADAIEVRFTEAGRRIEEALSKAARTGQLDFESMAEAVLRDLARMAAQSILGGGAGANAGLQQTINLNLSSQEQGARGIAASRGAIASLLAQAVAAGGRYQ